MNGDTVNTGYFCPSCHQWVTYGGQLHYCSGGNYFAYLGGNYFAAILAELQKITALLTPKDKTEPQLPVDAKISSNDRLIKVYVTREGLISAVAYGDLDLKFTVESAVNVPKTKTHNAIVHSITVSIP
jgi:hypothetical protein